MNRFLLIVVALLLLAGCQNAADANPTQPPATQAPTKPNEIEEVEADPEEVEVAPEEVATDTEVSPVAVPQPPEPTRVSYRNESLPLASMLKAVEDAANLTVALVDEENRSAVSEATVLVYADGMLVQQAETENGVYRTAIQSDRAYDIAILYHSTPKAGFLQKDVSLNGNETFLLEFVVPTEVNFEIPVRFASGVTPKNDFAVNLMIDEELIGTQLIRSGRYQVPSFILRTDTMYDIEIVYNDSVVQSEAQVSVIDRDSFSMILPFSENEIAIVVRDQGSVPRSDATATIFSESGVALLTQTIEDGTGAISLPTDVTYIVRVDYPGYLSQEQTVLLTATGLVQPLFDFGVPSTPVPEPTIAPETNSENNTP